MHKTPDGKDIHVLSKTPDEIKKGLTNCGSYDVGTCKGICPYNASNAGCVGELIRDALAYIQQLEAERDKYKRERDVAIEQLKEFDCATCKHCNLEHIASICRKCKVASKWEWRGVKEG